jgi:gliding motility-associated-like protein
MEPFTINDTVYVHITAQDRSSPPNAMLPQSYAFFVAEDREPPWADFLYPENGSLDIAINDSITLHLYDSMTGVDVDAIVMHVNGIEVTPDIRGTPEEYTLVYHPQTSFSYGQTYVIEVDARDRSVPNNVMPTQTWQFQTAPMLADLNLTSLRTFPTDSRVGESVRVFADLINLSTPIATPFDVSFFLNGELAGDTLISTLDSLMTITASCLLPPFTEEGTYQVEAVADYGNQIPEMDETNNRAEITIEVIAALLTVSPNPFTPNGDGYNDVCRFNFRGMNITNPEVTIYQFNGNKVISLTQAYGSEITWNGKNDKGKIQMPGVYMYVIKDGTRQLRNGTAVLAR